MDAISRSTLVPGKRFLLSAASRFHNRRFALATASVSILSAKLVHIYANSDALRTSDLVLWGPSFFYQDIALVLVLCLLLDCQQFITTDWLQTLAITLALAITGFVLCLAGFSISFYMVAGAELHWRNIGLAGESKTWGMFVVGLRSCVLVFATLLASATVLQTPCAIITTMAIDVLERSVVWLLSKLPTGWRARLGSRYQHLPRYSVQGAPSCVKHTSLLRPDASKTSLRWRSSWLPTLVSFTLVALTVNYLFQPADRALVFMSWTLPLMPIIDFAHSSSSLGKSLSVPDPTAIRGWDNLTALGEPIPWSWLPKPDTNASPLPGFEDWYEAGKQHYRADADPLKISNLNNKLLPEIRSKLADVNIRHVLLFKLESTRQDVFPFKKSGYLWRHLAESFDDKELPEEAQARLASLTPTANFVTGDYDDGFEHKEQKRRGGIHFNNAYTTSGYTLKSITGTLCGLTPLFADFNLDQAHHFYQPCLPHIFNALSKVAESDGALDGNFASARWKSTFLQAVTGQHGDQEPQMPRLGYAKENYINEEILRSGAGKFGAANVTAEEEGNYIGIPEYHVEKYLWDAFESARENNERAFVTLLTGSTHHPYKFPDRHIPLEKTAGDLSKYINSIGYVDRWLGKVLDFLDREGFANETLVIFLGDHGIPLAENGGITTYGNPHESGFHVPMVLSHPDLPPIQVDDPVTSIQILPTILDLLIETGSLSKSAAQAARDLVKNYEGQSLLRPRRQVSEWTAQGDWQVSVSNPGGSDVSVRDGRRPNFHLIIPIREDIKWTLSDLHSDPQEEDVIASFDLDTFSTMVERKYGIEIRKWVQEAATVANWYVKENHKRWRYKQPSNR